MRFGHQPPARLRVRRPVKAGMFSLRSRLLCVGHTPLDSCSCRARSSTMATAARTTVIPRRLDVALRDVHLQLDALPAASLADELLPPSPRAPSHCRPPRELRPPPDILCACPLRTTPRTDRHPRRHCRIRESATHILPPPGRSSRSPSPSPSLSSPLSMPCVRAEQDTSLASGKDRCDVATAPRRGLSRRGSFGLSTPTYDPMGAESSQCVRWLPLHLVPDSCIAKRMCPLDTLLASGDITAQGVASASWSSLRRPRR
ncbi:hypothetical protein FB45DRAFT_337109 [Roridomyces roridus]|uniref:Uncharacterized protein n=1 Tax=Roridomyces roridus TaxID=1738132 RepID=A0AAD7FBL1_9AGAR|nr:hypothetical protein FB45DRAFT_337109 [Roridomyces roridus]